MRVSNNTPLQEVFDIVATHLLTQNEKSEGVVNGEKTCMYRNSEGLMCAAGCLIEDAEYTKKSEGDLFFMTPYSTGVGYDLRNLIGDLQFVHDSSDPEDWLYNLTAVAHEHEFDTNSLERAKQ